MHELLNSRWLLLDTVDPLLFHHVEVIDIRDGLATVVTCYSIPLRSWIVPVERITDHPGAFYPLGPAKDFEWVRPGAMVNTTEAWIQNRPVPMAERSSGTWTIDILTADNVHFKRRPSTGAGGHVVTQGLNSKWPSFLRHFRLATREERRAAFDHEDRYELTETVPRPLSTPEAPEPEPTPIEPGPSESRSVWDHLGGDEG